MDTPKLSRLVRVPVRDVWPMEALGFTPWLLANAEVLGDALGIDLELTAAEHKVGGFSLDLVGRDISADERVIIENQFGATDHRHLGQLLTYAGGTEPATVVWIAESFRDEHRAALDWLNQRTDETTRFFGVQLQAMTMEGAPSSLVAPFLDVVVKPNDWGKAVKKVATGATSERGELYLAFWTELLDRVRDKGWTNRKGAPRHFLPMPSGARRARYTVSFRADGLLSELFFNHRQPTVNTSRLRTLEAKRSSIEASFGGPLIFDELPTRKGCRIGVRRVGGESIDKQEEWQNYLTWFQQTQTKLREAIENAGGIPPVPDDTDDEDSDDLSDGDAED